MVDLLIDNFRYVLVIAIVLVLVVGRFDRLVGAASSFVLWAGIAGLGSVMIARGHVIGFGTFALSPTVFYAICGVMMALYLFAGLTALRDRRARG